MIEFQHLFSIVLGSILFDSSSKFIAIDLWVKFGLNDLPYRKIYPVNYEMYSKIYPVEAWNYSNWTLKKELCTESIILVNYQVRIVQRLMHDNTLAGIFMMQLLSKTQKLSTNILFGKKKNLYILTFSPCQEVSV